MSTSLLVSPTFAMNKNNDDWETDVDSSHKRRSSSQFSTEEDKERLRQDFKAALQGNPSSNVHPPVGKIKIPQSLLKHFHEEGAESQNSDNQELFINIPSRPAGVTQEDSLGNNNSQSPVKIDNEKEQSTKSKEKTTFAQNLEDQTLQENTLISMGILVNEDNKASYFLSPEDLYERLVHNFHGHRLLLQKASFENLKSHLILEALKYTKSVRALSLAEAHLKPQHHLILGTALTYNRSLKELDLTKVSWTRESLFILGASLKDQKTLREIILRPLYDFTASEIEEFYGLLSSTKGGLRFILWPEKKEILSKIEMLSAKNPVAALHQGIMYAEGLLYKKDLKKAEKELTKAHQLGHWMAGYELGQLKEKSNQKEEALKWYLDSAQKGYAPAQFKVAEYYRGGWPKENPSDPDYVQAHHWCKKAADQEYPEAIYRLGRMYEGGRFVEKSLEWAAYYFSQALDWGHPEAFTALGALYQNPAYSGYDLETSKYYFKWAERFPETKGTSTRFLSIEKEK